MAVKIKKDGRRILTGKDYTEFKRRVLESQGGKCAQCAGDLAEWAAELHHKHGRGLGGGFRNDEFGECEVLCHWCHRRHTPI